jgi:acyl-homoserine lactone acylase PvdQ
VIEIGQQPVLDRHPQSLERKAREARKERYRFAIFAVFAFFVLELEGCRREPPLPPLVAQVSGSIEAAVSAPVRIVRDRWGVPHIYAQNADDLFFAQGFVQAQDRLFQLDLWRRSAQGRLSEVLGSNFAERDAMTRRMQYRGDLDAEWASYGADTKGIASAFVRGINAWAAAARERPPEEFVLAGWKPELWSPLDILNRTDAFVASGDAIDEVARAHLSQVVADAVRSVGTRPFFAGFAAPPGPRAEHPSLRYLVHLNAPGWNVIGATAPWRPGVAIGHNDRIAWDMTPAAVDTQDVYADKSAPADTVVFKDSLRIRGRNELFDFNREFTRHGVIVASDREHDLVFTVRWSGAEPGGAAELGALALDRARSSLEFRQALARWKMPARRVVYEDVDGARGFQVAALAPIRRGTEWIGWQTLDDLPHALKVTASAAAVSIPADRAAIVFAHPLAITDAARRRFLIGPLAPAGDPRLFRVVFDPGDWDRSRVMNAPGQSGSPESAHFSDLAKLWSSGGEVPLAYSDAAVQANGESTLTLVPAKAAAVPAAR